jgi:hypothetical protein
VCNNKDVSIIISTASPAILLHIYLPHVRHAVAAITSLPLEFIVGPVDKRHTIDARAADMSSVTCDKSITVHSPSIQRLEYSFAVCYWAAQEVT